MAFTRIHASSFSFVSAVNRNRHDVFLSFSGEDTRHSVTKHLHRALEDARVPTFKDDINLGKGGDIATELLKAIQTSRVALVVFSGNYAASGWCLDELVKIVDCKSEAGMEIVPVFYDVDPGDVLEQEKSYGEAFRKHEERVASRSAEARGRVEKWREALREAASSPVGWKTTHTVDSWHQSKFIKEIVKHIISRRQDAHMSASIFPPRMEAAKEYLNLLMTVISDDILIIGIWGVDTANIAKAVYNQNYGTFDASSFLPNVHGIAAERPNGLLALQKRFLSDILLDENTKIDDVKTGTEMIKNALLGKRVLAVLNNVCELDHLNAIARNRDWFGSGSRIVITTTDPQLLNVLEVDDVYGAQGIQVIKDQFRQNLETINHLVEYIQKFRAQAYENEMSLIAEIKSEQHKNALQERVIANLKGKSNQSDAFLTSTTEPETPTGENIGPMVFNCQV